MIRRRKTWAYRSGAALVVLGLLLLAATAIGQWTDAGRYGSFPPRSWERFDPQLVGRTPDLDSLFREAQTRVIHPFPDRSPEDTMEVLFETVADRFTHGDKARYTPFGNWVLWTLGVVNNRYRDIQDPDILLRNGHSALCGDVSYVLLRLASKAEIPARMILLNGHIIMEAWYSGEWHAYDPDLEIIVRDENGRVLSSEELIRNPSLLRKAYARRGEPDFVENVVFLFTTVADNRSLTFPKEKGIFVKGQRPGRVEQAGTFGKTVLPAAMVLIGAALLRGNRRGKDPGDQ